MKRSISALLKHPLISGSSIVLVGSFVANLFNYSFNLAIGRLLSVSDYGLVTSLISFILLLAIFQTSLIGIFAKFGAKFKASEDTKGFAVLLNNGLKSVVVIGFAIFVILLLLMPLLMNFLHISNIWFLILVFSYIFISILFSLPVGILQGEMRFFLISFLNIFAGIVKNIFGILFILLGLRVLGALLGVLLSILLPFAIALGIFLKKLKNVSVDEKVHSSFVKEFRVYGLNFFLASLGITIFSSVDILLVRHFFDPVSAGQYAALSLMGKVIFYLTSPINFVFFPLIARKIERKENVLKTLLLAVLIILIISTGISFVYFVFPSLILSIFFPAKAYASLVNYLGPFSLFILVFSVASLFNNFLLSVGKTGVYKINLIFSFLLILLIVLFHQSIYSIILVLFSVSFLLLLFLSGVMYKELKS